MTVILVQGETVSIDAKDQSHSVHVYPNPSSGKLFIKMDNAVNSDLFLLDIRGKVVLHKLMEINGNNEIDLSSFAKGLYLLKISNESGTLTKKIILE